MNLPFALQDSESVLIACRRHWMYLYPRLLGLSLLAIVPVVVLTAGLGLGPGLDGTLLWIVSSFTGLERSGTVAESGTPGAVATKRRG